MNFHWLQPLAYKKIIKALAIILIYSTRAKKFKEIVKSGDSG
jgi:hypothetical protein